MTSTAANPDMTHTGIASHYDDLDEFYRDIWGEHVHHGVWLAGNETNQEAAEKLVLMIADAAGIKPGMRVCDIGCGYGATARMLVERFGAEVTGMTLSPVQLAYAQKHNHIPGKTEFLLRDWYINEMPDQSFDAVVSIESLEHMPDLPRFFGEIRRVLKPGGKMAAAAWTSCEKPGFLARRLFIDAISREAHLAGIRPESEFLSGITAGGLAGGTVRDLGPYVKRTWVICVTRTIRGILTKPNYRQFLLSSRNPNRIFALTICRIWLAYTLGIQRYGFFAAHKPAS